MIGESVMAHPPHGPLKRAEGRVGKQGGGYRTWHHFEEIPPAKAGRARSSAKGRSPGGRAFSTRRPSRPPLAPSRRTVPPGPRVRIKPDGHYCPWLRPVPLP